jgi:hypothetical protein
LSSLITHPVAEERRRRTTTTTTKSPSALAYEFFIAVIDICATRRFSGVEHCVCDRSIERRMSNSFLQFF